MLNEVIFVIIVFLSNIIQAITGFAGTMLAMPSAILLVGINEAKAVLNVMGLLASLWITIKYVKLINKKEFIKITILMFIGMIIGIFLFKRIQTEHLLTIYGILIIAIAVKNLITEKKLKVPSLLMISVILLAGIIHGMFISGGALLVIYASVKFKEKSIFRATLAPVWVILNSYLFVNHINQGLFTSRIVILTLISIIPLGIGIYLGNIYHHRINQNLFMKMTYVLLFFSGISLLI